MARYTKTIIFNYVQELDSLPIGQWVQYGPTGARGQFLGTTRSGVDVFRWGKFSKGNAIRNKLQRKFAIERGAR